MKLDITIIAILLMSILGVTAQDLGAMPDSVLRRIASESEARRQYVDAHKAFEILYKRDTLNVESLISMSRITSTLGRYAESIRHLEAAYTQDTSNLFTSYQLLESYSRAEEHRKALKLSLIISNVDSTNYHLWGITAQSHQALRQDSAARVHYLKSLSLNPANVNLALKYLIFITKREQSGDVAIEALNVCDSVLHYNPLDRRVMTIKGQIIYKMEDYEQALKIFNQLLEMRDSTMLTFKYAGLSAKDSRQFSRAKEMLERAKNIDSTDISTLLALAEVYVKLTLCEDAEATIKLIEDVITPDPILLNTLIIIRGDSYAVMTKNNEAAKMYWQAYKQSAGRNFNMITKIYNLISSDGLDKFDNNRALFAIYTLTKNHIVNGEANRSFDYARYMILKYIERALMSGREHWDIQAPDGTPIKITLKELQELTSKMDKIYAKQNR